MLTVNHWQRSLVLALVLLPPPWAILPKASASCAASNSVKPLERPPIQIDTLYPGSSISLGCLDGTEPIFPDGTSKEWCSTDTASTTNAAICGQSGPVTTCKPGYYSTVDLFCPQGLYHIQARNGTRIGIPREVWCVPSPTSLWQKMAASFATFGHYYFCPLEATCDMTCGHDEDWCTSDQYADDCITDDPSFASRFSDSSIEECLMQQPQYLKEVCRGVVTPEGGQLPTGTPSLSPQITASDSVTVSTSTSSPHSLSLIDIAKEESSVVPVDSGTETEGTLEEEIPEDLLATDSSSASIHGTVAAVVIMGAVACCIVYV